MYRRGDEGYIIIGQIVQIKNKKTCFTETFSQKIIIAISKAWLQKHKFFGPP